MKQLKQFTPIIFVFAVLLFTFIAGCGGDDSPVTPSASGWPPDITMRPGQQLVYTNDSISSDGTHHWTKRGSFDVVGAQITFGGQLCYPVGGNTIDSLHSNTPTPEIFYVRYDAGKFYQYGIRNLINPGQPLTWDVVGDFTVSRGTSYHIADISYTYSLPGFPSANFTGPLSGKIADSTTIKTTSIGESIYCYRVELNATVSAVVSGVTIAGNIFVDYYIGYTDASHPTNPAGLVELNAKPFSFTLNGTPSIPEPGYDRKLYSHNP